MKENEIEAARNRITLAGRQAGLADKAAGVYRPQDNPFKPPRNGPWTVTADQYAWLWADAYMAAHGCSDRAKGTHPS